MKRVKYLNNRDLLLQIHASKNTYCSYVAVEDAQFDLIVPNLKKINANAIAMARKAKAKRLTQEAWETAKESGLKKIKLVDYTVSPRKIDKTDLVFRVMMYDHVPLDNERKKNPKQTSDHHTKVNFPPFQHFRLDKKGKPVYECLAVIVVYPGITLHAEVYVRETSYFLKECHVLPFLFYYWFMICHVDFFRVYTFKILFFNFTFFL